MKKYLIAVLCMMAFLQSGQAQFLKKIKERAKQAAEETVLRKTEEITAEETSKKIDTVYDKATKPKKNKRKKKDSTESGNDDIGELGGTEDTDGGSPNTFGVYSKFTFVPGNKQLFNDFFGLDEIGDFPAHWETAGSGEVVMLEGSEDSWLSLQRRSGYYPSIEKELPENYTIEFDLISHGYGNGSGNSKLYLAFLPKKAYSMGQAGSVADIELLFGDFFSIKNVENFGNEAQVRVANIIDRNRTDLINAPMHISIAVNKKRLRLWVNEEKYVDSPNLLQGKLGRHFIIEARDILPEKGHFVGITNFMIAESSEDLRSLLLKNGKYATTGIYFDYDSWVVKPESYGVIKEIADVLTDTPQLNLKIVGHTDNSGDVDYNQSLSENRAEAVKQVLVEQFGIPENRLEFEGKGETEPVDDNNTLTGKANNRRVEFIKI
ncbi:OmpA family protein [Flagellimonas taeanensis]|uniref:OmpA family protein n=1 Tax=Flagellimonas taeanensis TaxID=1005926 RepID=A0A1M6REG4_9FLAO|nr:OmpA family protein [Allomuricauda taeanensis]SFB75105.1 OmpA family protein [Allomuricauda taeanensis]SHK30864.1 OmpA family protein [Allomuricauda taeanensis]